MSFKNLKSKRTDVKQLVSAAKKLEGVSKDNRFWKPTVSREEVGYAVIRFLPEYEGAELPWVSYYHHFFKGATGQFYVEKSLTTIDKPDPVSEYNTALWNAGDEATAKRQKRKLTYVSNILVITDSENTDAEGKVFLFEYGKEIFDIIKDAMQPKFPDEKPINPFDFWEGADFVLKISKKEDSDFRTYKKSEFRKPAALFDGDEKKLEEVYNQMHDLSEFVSPDRFKSYEELKNRLELVLGKAVGEGATVKNEALTQTAEPPVQKSEDAPEIPVMSAAETPRPEIITDDDGGGEASGSETKDDLTSYFDQLANKE